MDPFECVTEWSKNSCKVFKNKTSETHANALDEADGALLTSAGIRLRDQPADAVIDTKDKFLASCFQSRFHPSDSSGPVALLAG
jgi:hypothetical protein